MLKDNTWTYMIFFQVATDKCIMAFLFLIVCGVIAVIVVKVCFFLKKIAFLKSLIALVVLLGA
jgi:hypothetical protein